MAKQDTQSLESLMISALEGDQQAYQKFLTQVERYIRRIVSNKVVGKDVEDVVQEALISIHKARHTYDGKRAILPWVSAITRFRITDYLRKHYAKKEDVYLDADEMEKTLADNVTEADDSYEYINDEISLLPEKQQKILYLMYFEGYTAKETGAQLGMKESAVKVAAHRSYKVIRQKLEKKKQ